MTAAGLAAAIQHLRDAEARWLPEFRLEYSVVSGAFHGPAPEYEQRLQVKGTGEVTLFRRRSPGDTAELPPGLFVGRLSREQLLDLLARLEKAPLDAVPTQVPSPHDPVFRLTCVLTRKVFAFQWSPPAPPVPQPLAALFNVLNDWMGRACPEAVWTLALKVVSARVEAGVVEAVLRLENAGREAIHVVHPGSPGEPEDRRVELVHGVSEPEEPGVTPLPIDFEEALLEAPSQAEVGLVPVTKEKGLEFTARAPADFTGGGGRIGVFGYASYVLPAAAAGMEVFAGAVYSEEVAL